ncbi:hypothetical protein CWO90_09125 [Bradyrhizobium sp. Leo121]|nr:hypothetical protein CWO90_09125 [Bradyrhizobium sp. Leo121]
MGNAVDRLRLGAVVDLFDASKLRFAWVFNVADVSIDLGIALILLAALLPSSEVLQQTTVTTRLVMFDRCGSIASFWAQVGHC